MAHPNSFQTIYHLQQEIPGTFAKNATCFDRSRWYGKYCRYFHLVQPHKSPNRLLVLAIIHFLAIITLLALKCILAYLHKIVEQNGRDKAVFTVRLQNPQHN